MAACTSEIHNILVSIWGFQMKVANIFSWKACSFTISSDDWTAAHFNTKWIKVEARQLDNASQLTIKAYFHHSIYLSIYMHIHTNKHIYKTFLVDKQDKLFLQCILKTWESLVLEFCFSKIN